MNFQKLPPKVQAKAEVDTLKLVTNTMQHATTKRTEDAAHDNVIVMAPQAHAEMPELALSPKRRGKWFSVLQKAIAAAKKRIVPT